MKKWFAKLGIIDYKNKTKTENQQTKEMEKLHKSENAQSVVEFALILPILLALVLGMIEFGWLLNAKITVTSAAREGARVAVVSLDPQGSANTAVGKSLDASGVNLISVTLPAQEEGSDTIVVIVKGDVEPIIGLFVSDNVELTSQATMRKE